MNEMKVIFLGCLALAIIGMVVYCIIRRWEQNDPSCDKCETRIKRYEKEIKRLEERLANSDHTEFWNVETYFNHCRENAAEDDDIIDTLRSDGFDSLADEHGLTWIRQIYLPRVKESCLRN
jgi:hypothetical protein